MRTLAETLSTGAGGTLCSSQSSGRKRGQMGLVHSIRSSSKEFSIRAGRGSSTPALRREQDNCVSVEGHRVPRGQWTHKFLRTCKRHAPTIRGELGSTVTRVQTGAHNPLLCFAAGVDEAPRLAHYSHTAGCRGPSPIHDPSAAEWTLPASFREDSQQHRCSLF